MSTQTFEGDNFVFYSNSQNSVTLKSIPGSKLLIDGYCSGGLSGVLPPLESGQIIVGNSSGGGYSLKNISKDATLNHLGEMTLNNSGVVPGTYGPFSIGSDGRINAASSDLFYNVDLDESKIWIGSTGNKARPRSLSGVLNISAGGSTSLNATGVLPNIYSNPTITISEDGRISAASSGTTPILPPATNAQMLISDGTNNYISKTLSGDVTVDKDGICTIKNSGVSAGAYTNSNVTVNSKGIVTSISNGSVVPVIPKFFISNNCICYGDNNLTENWVNQLEALCGKPLTYGGPFTYLDDINGGDLDTLISSNPTRNFIIMFGANESRNTASKDLYLDNSMYQWYLQYTNMIVSMCCHPSNNYYMGKDWTRSTTGGVSDWSSSGWGAQTAVKTSTLTLTLNARYYAFSFRSSSAESGTCVWEIYIGGSKVKDLSYTHLSANSSAYNRMYIVDMGTKASRSIIVKNLSNVGVKANFQYICHWHDASTSMREVMAIPIPLFDQYSVPILSSMHRNELIKLAVANASNMKLPAYMLPNITNHINNTSFDIGNNNTMARLILANSTY